MKRLYFLFAASLLMAAPVFAQPKIVPQPVEVKSGDGFFRLSPSTAIGIAGNNADAKRVADMLAKKLGTVTGFNIPVTGGAINLGMSNIVLQLLSPANNTLGTEGYQLKVGAGGTQILANSAAGLFYGVQTFLQLLPAEVEGGKKVENLEWKAPVTEVLDYPRFGWRGLMLDVSRHFFTKDEVKRYIDDMVKYKFNLLHWHLTDDQGWRIEIKSYPRLTEVGAWNVKKEGRFNTFSAPEPGEPRNYGGFYTQEDIKEVVQYAKDRFVNVLPEIDVPGHSLAAIAAYPELTSTPGTYQVNSGEKFMEWPPSGHFYGLIDNALNPSSEKVYTFLDKVFGEIAQLYPFDYIHMGGDETARNFWEKSEDIKKLMAKEKLKNLDEVQSYFVKRVTKIVNSKGKKLIGWDEILQGGLAPGAAVMSWRGMDGGIAAAKQGHEVVMSPTNFVYIDYMQGDRLMEPLVYASLRLKKSYEFEPVPSGVDPKLIKGGQANLWTEQIYNLRQAQYMTWPRAFAISEAVWSPQGGRNFSNFVTRVENQLPKLDQAQTKWAPSMYEPDIKAAKGAKNILVTLIPEVEGLDMHYSFDNSWPDQYYPKYASPLEVPKDADKMRIATFKNGKQVGRFMTISVEELKARAGK